MNSKHETDLRLAIMLTQRAEYDSQAKRASIADTIDLIAKLNRYSRSLHRHAERACSDESYTPVDRARGAKIEAKARALCEAWGIACDVKTDPRAGHGLAVRVGGQEFYLANSKGN